MIRTTSRRLRSALVALTITAAAAGTSVAVAGPAGAVTQVSCSTKTVVDVNGHTSNQVVKWGDYESVHVNVSAACSDGKNYVSGSGITTLYKSTDGGNTWTTLKRMGGYGADYVSYYGTNVITRNTLFYAKYSGGAYGNGYTQWNYAASNDNIVAGVIRHTAYKSSSCGHRGCTAVYKITPIASIQGLKVTIQKHNSTGWHFNTAVTVSSTGTLKHFFRPGKYRFLLPGKRGFLKSTYGTITVS
ncbi:hypothetical protein [Nocardioides montaniterrae]